MKSNKSFSDKSQSLGKVIPASLSWHNIEVFSKPTKKLWFWENKQSSPVKIIKNVSGRLGAGSTLAIMGSSGAGKTTLLNVLTARNLSNFTVDGLVKINNEVADVHTISSSTAYVQQEDLFIPTLTVREHLVFHALIRMYKDIPISVKARRVNHVMRELSLVKCADVKVGGMNTTKGISGGEMKRLSFAVEILTNPSIMFCDEPTSGLDAFMAESLIRKVQQLAQAGRTIICTIHQPSSDVFNLFDKLLLLADGRVAYMGNLSVVIDYFAKLGIHCPVNYNPADFFIKELSIVPGKDVESRRKINMICEYYSATHQEIHFTKQSSYQGCKKLNPFKAGILQQFRALGWRSNLVAKREPIINNIRVAQALVISTMLGLLYFGQKYDERGILNINGALFLFITSLTNQNTYAVIHTFCGEFPIFYREHNNGVYRVAPYFVCKNIAEFPVFVFIPILFVLIFYFMIGFFPDLRNFLEMMLIGIFISLCGVSFGYCISCICAKTDIALSVTPPLMMPLQVFGGYYINKKNVPIYFVWAQYLSWFYYGFELLINNQWGRVKKIHCDNEQNSSSTLGRFCNGTGQNIIHFLDFNTNHFYLDLFLLTLIILGLRIISFFALLLRSRQR